MVSLVQDQVGLRLRLWPVTWGEYEEGVEDRITDLHDRIHRGAYRAQPSRRVYGKLLDSVGRVVGQAKRFSREICEGVKRCSDFMQQAVLEGLRQEIDTMLPRVKQVSSDKPKPG